MRYYIVGPSAKELSFEAAIDDSAMLIEHDAVICSSGCICEGSCSMEAWMEYKTCINCLLRKLNFYKLYIIIIIGFFIQCEITKIPL